ncbi:hypothetical protein AAC387_Pa08g0513 [Persea americana]
MYMDVAVGPCVSDHVMGHDPAPKVSFPDSSRKQDSWGHAAFRKPRADVIAERAHLAHSKKERCMEHAETRHVADCDWERAEMAMPAFNGSGAGIQCGGGHDASGKMIVTAT